MEKMTHAKATPANLLTNFTPINTIEPETEINLRKKPFFFVIFTVKTHPKYMAN